jgi:prepilin-type N-terminal cleavage/methylation domain-containing protein
LRGFSVFELLIVLAIATILTGLAVGPSFMLSDNIKFQTAKAQLNQSLGQARNWARARKECVSLTVSGTQLSIKGYTVTTQPCPLPLPLAQADQNTTLTVNLPYGTSLSAFTKKGGGTITTFIFNPQGGTDYSDIALTTISLGSYSAQFQILPITGQIVE